MWWFRAGLALLVGITVLAGCGFQLRGQARQLPAEMATTFIDYSALGNISPADPLARRLRQSLIGNGINVVDSPQAASARLQILSADYRRRTLASGRRGAVREYRLSYQLRFALTGPDGAPLQPPTDTEVTRDVLYDETQVLGTEAGLAIARDQLLGDAIDALLRRLQY